MLVVEKHEKQFHFCFKLMCLLVINFRTVIKNIDKLNYLKSSYYQFSRRKSSGNANWWLHQMEFNLSTCYSINSYFNWIPAVTNCVKFEWIIIPSIILYMVWFYCIFSVWFFWIVQKNKLENVHRRRLWNP